jgi:hypothetical protein
MTITFVYDGRRLPARLPYDAAEFVLVADLPVCPRCGVGLKVAGRAGTEHHDHDTYYAEAGCVGCGATLGELQAKVSTIFGIDEDEAVLNGRCRVY